jgi:hypothetical protein
MLAFTLIVDKALIDKTISYLCHKHSPEMHSTQEIGYLVSSEH